MRHRRRLLLSDDATENFWPSFTDLTSTIVLILFVLVLLAYIRNLIAGKNLDYMRGQLEQATQRLGSSQEQVRNSEARLRALEVELSGTTAQIEEQKTLVEESNRQLGSLRSKLQSIAVLRVDVLNKVKQAVEAEIRGDAAASGASLVSIADNGNVVINESLVFEYNSFAVKSNAKSLLATLARAFANVLADPNVRENIDAILIQGHTDERGSASYNRELSAKRASAVVDYMFEASPVLERTYGRYFAASAYSKFRPINPAKSEEAFQQNRRIEISVVPKDANVRKVIDDYLNAGPDH